MNSITVPRSSPVYAGTISHILQFPNMLWYFGTQVVSLTGLMLRGSVISLLLLALLGADKVALVMGTIWAMNVLPGAFLGAFAGLYIDRSDKRKVLTVTAIVSVLQAVALAYIAYAFAEPILREHRLVSTHHPIIIAIFVLALIGGFANALDGICRNVIVKDALPDMHDKAANRKNQTLGGIMFTALYTLAMPVGDGISGYMVHWFGYAATFVIVGMSFMVLIFGLSRMNFSHRSGEKLPWKGVWHSLNENARYAARMPVVRTCILVAAAITVLGFSYRVTLTIIAKTMFSSGPHHGGPQDYSFLAASAGIGSFVGAVITMIYSARKPVQFVVCGCLMCGLSQVLLVFTRDIHVGAILLFFTGCGFMPAFMPFRGVMMHVVEDKRIGIVFGFMFMFFYGSMMASSFIAGYITKHFGCPAVLGLCGTGLMAVALLVPLLPSMKELKQ